MRSQWIAAAPLKLRARSEIKLLRRGETFQQQQMFRGKGARGRGAKFVHSKIWSMAMGLFSKDIRTFDDLFLHTLQDVYYAEHQITKALPEMIEKAADPELKQGFETHLQETKNQIKRLEDVFNMLGQSPKAVNCPAIDGIIEEANDVAGETAGKEVLDSALTASAQAVEHYEITRYGTLIAWAKQLGRTDCANLLHQTLEEERATDKKLTELAERKINRRAA
jgi:ferritin-like metal-binding protein YciE